MGVDIQTYRARIGTYTSACGKEATSKSSVNISRSITCIGCFVFIGILLLMAGIESNPGPWTQELPDDFPETKSVYISGVPETVEKDYVEFKFCKYGTINDVQEDSENSGCFVVTFVCTTGVENVQKAEPMVINKSIIDVKPFYPNIIKVRGISLDDTTGHTDELRTFFEKEAGGETVDDIIVNSVDNSVYVIFKSADGTKTVNQKRKVSFQDQLLEVSYVHDKNIDSDYLLSSDQVLEKGDENEIRNTRFNLILKKCELEKEYQNKIKMRDVVALDSEEDGSKRIMSYKELPWKLLKGLLYVNCDARDRTVDFVTTTFKDISEIDDISNDGNEEISPLDIFHVVYQCCDSMLQQILFQKLFLCKLAVPFIYIRHADNSPICALWPLRSLKIYSHIETSKNTLSEIGVLDISTNVVTVARIGRPEFSKSTLINALLSDTENRVFYNETCNMGTVNRTLSVGSIEMFWLPYVRNSQSKNVQMFEKNMTFLNIRGDFKRSHSDAIIKFSLAVSDCFLFLVDIWTVINDTNSFKLFLTYFVTRRVIIVLAGSIPDEKKQFLKYLYDEWTKYDIRLVFTHKQKSSKNVCEITTDLSKKLKEQLNPFEPKSLESRLVSINDIETDETNDDCIKGKECAEKYFSSLKSINEVKQLKMKITPIYILDSEKLCAEIKSYHRAINEEDRKKHEAGIKLIRQGELCRVSTFIVEFTKCIISFDEASLRLYFFLEWINIFFQSKYNVMRQTNVEDILKYDDLFREIGLIYDTLITLREDHIKYGLPPPHKMANVFTKLLIGGYHLELLEGNTFYLPSNWIRFVFQTVSETTKKSKFLSLSVLGVQSSGKSTLLNTIFGSQFPAYAGRCTRGIHIQFIPVRLKPKSCESPFDYVLVFDTEGLRAPELYDGKLKHDNELATLITGIGDISIINIMGENSSEIHETLNLIVYALLQLKMANENIDILKCCYFVHQNVLDYTAREKKKQGLHKLTQSLDICTKEAAEFHGISDINSFNDIITFDITSNVWYFPNFWQGVFPMCYVNREYSSQVCAFRTEFLNNALEISYKSYKSISDIADHITELWQGVLNEGVLFSFRSSIELKAHLHLSDEMDQYETEIERIMHQTLIKLSKAKLLERRSDQLDCFYLEIKMNLSEVLKSSKLSIIDKIHNYFETNEYREVMYTWKDGTIWRFEQFCLQLLDQLVFECKNMYDNKKVYLWTEQVDNAFKDRLFEESKELARQFRETDIKPNIVSIDGKINEIWEECSKPYFSEIKKQNNKPIADIFTECLSEIFCNDTPLLKLHLVKQNLTFLKIKLTETFDDMDIKHKDMIPVKSILKASKLDIQIIKEHVEQFFDSVETRLEFYFLEELNTTEQSIKHILSEVNAMLSKFKKEQTPKFRLNRIVLIKILIHVSRRAMYLFDEKRKGIEETRDSRISEHKIQAREFLILSFNNRAIEEKAALELVSLLTNFCQEKVETCLPDLVKTELKEKLPTSKAAVLLKVMETLMIHDNFELFREYINSPNLYIEKWIANRIRSILADGIDSNQDIYYKEASKMIEIIFKKFRRAIQNYSCDKVNECMQYFKENLELEEISINSFDSVEKIFSDNKNVNLKHFIDIVLAHLKEKETVLKGRFAYIELENMTWKTYNPLSKLLNKLKGCVEQCPYCAEPCILSSNHSENHMCYWHKPQGCRCIYSLGENRIVLSDCTLDVRSNEMHSCNIFSYICNEGKERPCRKGIHMYSEYKKYFPSWDLRQTLDTENAFIVWKWFIARFKNELSDKNIDVSETPSTWDDITVDDVLSTLNLKLLETQKSKLFNASLSDKQYFLFPK